MGCGGHTGRQDFRRLFLHRFQALHKSHAVVQHLTGGRHGARTVGIEDADVDGVHVERLGQCVHLTLMGHGHLRHAESAEGARHGIVGIVEGSVHPDVGDLIGAGRMDGGAGDDRGAIGGIGAGIAQQRGLHGQDLAVLGGAGLIVHLHGVALGGDHGGLLPAAHHLDRAVGIVGEQGRMALDRDIQLAAEPAAGGHLHRADPVVGEVQHGRHLAPVIVGVLRGGVHCHDAVFIAGQAAVRLNEHMGEHGGLIVVLDDDVALGKGLIHISVLQVLALVDIGVPVDLGGICLGGPLHREDRLDLLILHPDGRQRVLQQVGGLGCHHGNGVAIAADLVVHQDGLILKDDADAVLARNVLGGQHTGHPRNGEGRGGIKGLDVSGRDRAAEHPAIEHVGHLQIGGKAGGPPDLLHGVLLDHALAQNRVTGLDRAGHLQLFLL